jgi:acyl-CoA thioesterase FadM
VSGWLETYRGIVYRWEVDHNDHLTVAFYFAHLDDAALGLLEALGLGAGYTRRRGRLCVTTDCYVRYLRELRVGDILHAASGVIAIEKDALVLGHKIFNSETGDVCTTVEQRVRHADTRRHAACAFTSTQRRAAERHRVEWDAPARERRPRPGGLEGFRESARDTVKPGEVDVRGQIALTHYVHRFSAANGHATAAFGITPGYMRSERRGFSTFEFQLELGGAARPGDSVCVRSALVHVGNSSMRLLHVMTNERTGERIATLEQLGVHLDMDARRPTPLPDAIRSRAQAMVMDVGGPEMAPHTPQARGRPVNASGARPAPEAAG